LSFLMLPAFGLVLLCTANLAAAKELSAYRVGDLIDEDIVAPAEFVVPDPAATIALKTSEALKTPPVYRSFPAITNIVASQFEVAFDTAHVDFLACIQQTFHATVLDHATVMSPDFDYFLTAYNIDHPTLPLPAYLAMDWAYGKDGSVEKMLWLNKICALMQNLVRPDELPAGFETGNSVQLVSVMRLDEILTPMDMAARSRSLPPASMVPLSQVQLDLRREFTRADEQLFARALSAWLQPNCLPDPVATQEIRDEAVRRMVVAECYSAGQIIAHKGTVVDQKIMAALDQLTRKMSENSTVSFREWHENQPTISVDRMVAVDESMIPDPGPPLPTDNPVAQANDFPFKLGLLLGTITVAAILLIILRQIFQPQGRSSSLSLVPNGLDLKHSPGLQSELAPQLLQVVRQAFIQELSGQRRDLLLTQQTAAAEVVNLVKRMDALQITMQDRLRTYEAHIKKLESELTARKEENRQLIRLKIQMFRHQVDVETSPQRVELN